MRTIMRTPEEIMKDVNGIKSYEEIEENYHWFMLEIMCNLVITLDKIAKERKNDN